MIDELREALESLRADHIGQMASLRAEMHESEQAVMRISNFFEREEFTGALRSCIELCRNFDAFKRDVHAELSTLKEGGAAPRSPSTDSFVAFRTELEGVSS